MARKKLWQKIKSSPERLAYWKVYREANKAKLKEKRALKADHIKEVRKLWYSKNRKNAIKYTLEWINKNKEYVRKRTKNSKITRKRILVEMFGDVCADCKLTYPYYCYDFHHLDPTVKDRTVSYWVHANWPKALEEAEKCVMLCSNCHRARHFEDTLECL